MDTRRDERRKVKEPDAQALRRVRVLRDIYDARTGEVHIAGEIAALDPRQWPVEHWLAKGVLAAVDDGPAQEVSDGEA